MVKACVYLTIYLGNKLPPFYIGSSWVKNIEKGYKGSVASTKYKEVWRNEIINNPHLFKVKIISICNTREDAYKRENELQRLLNVVENSLYSNQYVQGVTHSKETRKKISKTLTGKCYRTKEKDVECGRKRQGKSRADLSKAVAQYDKHGILINTYISATAAALSLNTKTDNISSAASGRYKHSCGYQWRYYIDTPLPKIEEIKMKSIPRNRSGNYKQIAIGKYDLSNNLLTKYASLKDAALKNSIDIANICSGIKSGGSRNGYYWKEL